MSDYQPPLRDIRFVFEHIAGLRDLAQLDAYAHADPETVAGLVEEAGRFCAEAVAPTNREGDVHGTVLRDGEVILPESFQKVYSQYVEAGWGALHHPAEFGGGEFPLLVANAFKEMLNAANLAFSLGPLLTTGAVYALSHHGSDELKQTYLPKMVSGEWTGTMNLTEPQAGSDVGAVTTKAVPAGRRHLPDHGAEDLHHLRRARQLTENIIHLVLARLPDAPPGTKGISLFIVPKFLVDDDGSLGERNDVTCVSHRAQDGHHGVAHLRHGLRRAGDGAVGYLVGARTTACAPCSR
jgi:3-(methylthio)propanoyl-CoA dehydrogenase